MTREEAIERMEMLRQQYEGALLTTQAIDMAIEALTNKNLKKPKNTREVNEEIVGCTYCIHKYEYQCAFMDGEYNVNGDCHWGERIEKLDGKG